MASLSRAQWIQSVLVISGLFLGFLFFFSSSKNPPKNQTNNGLFGFLFEKKVNPFDDVNTWFSLQKNLLIQYTGAITTELQKEIFHNTKIPSFTGIQTQITGSFEMDADHNVYSKIIASHMINIASGLSITHNIDTLVSSGEFYVALQKFYTTNDLMISADLFLREQLLKNYTTTRFHIPLTLSDRGCKEVNFTSDTTGASYHCRQTKGSTHFSKKNTTIDYASISSGYTLTIHSDDQKKRNLQISGEQSSIAWYMEGQVYETTNNARQKSYTFILSYQYGRSIYGSGSLNLNLLPKEKVGITPPQQFLEWEKIMRVLKGE